MCRCGLLTSLAGTSTLSSRGGTLRQRAKPIIGAAAESVWSAAFAALAWRSAAGDRAWRPVHRRVLVIAPHPDDESIGCAGTLLRHKQSGASVTVLCVTDGRTSRAAGLGADEMAALGRRFREDGLYTFVRWNTFFTNPPLTISEEEMAEGFEIIDRALEVTDAAVR